MDGGARKSGSVVWAIDPFEVDVKPIAPCLRELGDWISRAGLRFLPAHVVSVTARESEAGTLAPLPTVEAALRNYLRHFPVEGAAEAQVLVDQTASRLGAVKELIEFAQSEDAEWIVVSSHGRSGMKRLVLGSFAEVLLRESPVPVLFLPRRPFSSPALESRRAFFPTDFSASAEEAYRRFLPVARQQAFEVVLYHMLTYPMPTMDLTFVQTVPESFLPEQAEWARRAGKRWVELAAGEGVTAQFLLESADVPVLSGQSILHVAEREHARLIVMPTFSGLLTRLVVGSVSFDVFRSGLFPVWLYGAPSLHAHRPQAA